MIALLSDALPKARFPKARFLKARFLGKLAAFGLLFAVVCGRLNAQAAAAPGPDIPCSYSTTGDASNPGAIVLCPPPIFTPTTALSFSTPGRYAAILLGHLGGALLVRQTAVAASVLGDAPNLTLSNLQLTSTAPDGAPATSVPTLYVYGDVNVSAGPASSTGLLLNFTQNGLQILTGLDALNVSALAGPTPSGCPSNVTAGIRITPGKAMQLFGTALWVEVVTVKNTSGAAITGPIQLALANLSANARLFAGAGTGTCPGIAGAPYAYVSNGLAANGSANVVLTLTNSGLPSRDITFTPTVVAGGSTL